MQAAAWAHWEAVADREQQPDRPEDFGFFGGWERAKEIGQVFSQYQILPSAGGWMDQTVTDRYDILMYLSGLARANHEYDEIHDPTPSKGGTV